MSAESGTGRQDGGSDEGPGTGRDPLDAIAEEFLGRRRRGEAASASEYARRYPERAAEIAALFPTLLEIDEAGAAWSGRAIRRAEPPSLLGDFRILREIARGGMGVVYEAEQVSLGRRVALKVLSADRLGDPRLVERFRREARAAARLHHTNIVPVHGTGETDGLLYYAMQFIDGCNLADLIAHLRRTRGLGDAGGPGEGRARAVEPILVSAAAEFLEGSGDSDPVRGRQRYFRRVAAIVRQAAEALAYAHEEGFLHRDIKPSNLLLDGRGHPWVTDFGLAKDEEAPGLTQTGDFVGTVPYMAPERLDGRGDARSDVYGLGVTLYELLTLRRAFPQRSRAEILRAIAHDEPRRPRRIDPRIPRDLETIVIQAVERNPERRYASARAMAEDLGRHLESLPIRARRLGAAAKAVRWARSEPLAAGLAVASAVLLVALSVGASVAALHLRKERDVARAAVASASERLRDSAIASARLGRRSRSAGQRFRALADLKTLARSAADADVLTEATASLGLLDLEPDGPPRPAARALAMHGESGLYVTAEEDGTLGVWRFDGAERIGSFGPVAGQEGKIEAARFGRAGRILGVGTVGACGYEVRLLDVPSLDVLAAVASPGPRDLAFDVAPDDRRYAVRVGPGRVAVRDVAVPSSAGGEVILEAGTEAERLAFSPGGERLAVASTSFGSAVEIWDLARRSVAGRLVHGVAPMALAWAPGGDRLAVAAVDYRTYIWDVDLERIDRVLSGHSAEVWCAEFDSAGKILATASWDGESRFWDAATGVCLVRAVGAFLGWGPGDRWAGYSVGTRGVGRWRLPEERVVSLASLPVPGKGPRTVAISPREDLVAAGRPESGLWVARPGESRFRWIGSHDAEGLAFTPDGGTLFVGTRELLAFPVRREAGSIEVGEPRVVSPFGGVVAVSGDGGFVVSASADRGVHLHALADGGVPRLLGRHEGASAVAVSPGGRWVAVSSFGGTGVAVFDGVAGKLARVFPMRHGNLAFSPDGTKAALVTGKDVELLETDRWTRLWAVPREEGGDMAGSAEFTRDGRLLFAGLSRRSVACLDASEGDRLFSVELQSSGEIRDFAWGGRSTLVLFSTTRHVETWDLGAAGAIQRRLGFSAPLPFDSPASWSVPAPPFEVAAPPPAPRRPGWSDRVRSLSRTIEECPDDPAAYELRARAFLEGGRLSEAAADLSRALALGPARPATVHFLRAQIHERRLELVACVDDCAMSLAHEPDAPEAVLLCARALDRSGRHAESLRTLEDRLARNPEDVIALELAAQILLRGPAELRDAPRAARLAARAVALAPRAASVLRTHGAARLRTGRDAEALGALERAVELPGGDRSLSAWLFLAMARARSGDLAGARTALARGSSLERAPDFTDAERRWLAALRDEARAAVGEPIAALSGS